MVQILVRTLTAIPYADMGSRPSVMTQAEQEQESDDETWDEGDFSDEAVDLADYI